MAVRDTGTATSLENVSGSNEGVSAGQEALEGSCVGAHSHFAALPCPADTSPISQERIFYVCAWQFFFCLVCVGGVVENRLE